jgi:hypothetical protein
MGQLYSPNKPEDIANLLTYVNSNWFTKLNSLLVGTRSWGYELFAHDPVSPMVSLKMSLSAIM